MGWEFHDELKRPSLRGPYARLLQHAVVEVRPGTALVRMPVRSEGENIFGATHGGALFSLIDEAFQPACNAHGVLSENTVPMATFLTHTYPLVF